LLHTGIVDIKSKRHNGVKIAEVIDQIASDNSRLFKEDVLSKMMGVAIHGGIVGECLFYNLHLATNPYFVPGYKRIPLTENIEGDNPWSDFWTMCQDLQDRKLTGHNARDAVEAMSKRFDSYEWNTVCHRVLKKDLKAGISSSTVNKIAGKTKFKVPGFGVQLAQDSKGQQNKMTGRKRLEGKLDGVRMIAIKAGNTVKLFSRNGKEFENFPDIEEAIRNITFKTSNIFNITDDDIVLDGEVMGESFQKLMKQARRKSDAQTENMVYNIFDVMPLSAFSKEKFNITQEKRTQWLEEQRAIIEESPVLKVTQGIEVDLNTAEGHNVLKRYANDAVNAGLEGIMIKDLEASYECKRSSAWMKWKPVITVDLSIIDIKPGTGKYEGSMGSLICEGIDDGKRIHVQVGSGYSDEQRDEYWNARDTLIGQVVEVMADAVTKDQSDDEIYSLRFPRFVRFRGFEAGEKM